LDRAGREGDTSQPAKSFLVEEYMMPKGFNPMQQVKALQEKMSKIQADLALKKVEASAGGGMVTVEVSGKQEVLSVKIDRQVVDPEDIEMLQDLIVAAVNDGLRRAQEMAASEMGKLAGGLNIPGLNLPGLF
jgi:DNA-binding YbaB/EbfC family protein